MLHPAKARDKLLEWQETNLDRKGRPIEVTGYDGEHILLEYDESGAPAAAVQKTPDGKANCGYNVKRDKQGRITAVHSSWGDTAYTHDKEGSLRGIFTTYGNQSASIDLAGGRVRAMTGVDGGWTSFEYNEDGLTAGMPRSIAYPNVLKLECEYDGDRRLSAVKVGTDRRVRLGYDPQGRLNVYAWEAVRISNQ